MSQVAPSPTAPELSEKLAAAALGLAIVLGILGALGASVFIFVMDEAQKWIWEDLPAALGFDGLPMWWVALMLLIGACVVALAWRLPGATGNGPLTGFHFDTPAINAPSILLAALGSLIFGFVLGPEAPLIIMGTTIGALLMRGRAPQLVQMGMLLGGAAAIGAIFGNPFVMAFMLLEFAALGVLPAIALVPSLVALGSGYLVQIGVGPWSGIGTHSLAVPGLPTYDNLNVRDLIFGLVIAVVASIVAAIARELGERVAQIAAKHRGIVLFAVALLTAALAIAVTEITGVDVGFVLFSGQSDMTSLIAETSILTVVLVLIAKTLAYGMALGGGYRGGPIFPATFLGVAVGVLSSLVFPEISVTAMAATGIAATATVMLRLPFTSALLAMVLLSSSGAAVAPFAIMGAVVGFGVRQGLDKRDAKRTSKLELERV
jgi:H+/Cl- antiporter ClcA